MLKTELKEISLVLRNHYDINRFCMKEPNQGMYSSIAMVWPPYFSTGDTNYNVDINDRIAIIDDQKNEVHIYKVKNKTMKITSSDEVNKVYVISLKREKKLVEIKDEVGNITIIEKTLKCMLKRRIKAVSKVFKLWI